jgi:hypothetical protein
MKLFAPFLLLILYSCGNETAPNKEEIKHPVTIQFFETYNMNDIREEWLSTFNSTETGTRVYLGKDSSNWITIKGLRSIVVNEFNTAIAFVKTSDVHRIDSVLEIPEVALRFPKDLQFMWSLNPSTDFPEFKGYNLYAVKIPKSKKAPIDSRDILESVPALDKDNPEMVDIYVTLTKSGARKMESFSRKNSNKHIAITIDGKMVSCSQVWTVITNRMEIDGGFTMEQAGELSDRINAGR